jgi:hypothetical protein
MPAEIGDGIDVGLLRGRREMRIIMSSIMRRRRELISAIEDSCLVTG